MNDVVDLSRYSETERDAHAWAARIDRGELSAKEEAALKRWLAADPENRAALIRVAEMWGRLAFALGSETTAQTLRSRNETGSRRRWPKLTPARGMAAGLIALVASGVGIFGVQTYRVQSSNGVYETAIGEQQTVVLADGSTIVINTDSKLTVNYSRARRSILLERGESNFAVASNRQSPFVVSAGNGQVMAVGTEFSVRLDRELVEVLVSEGKVRIGARLDAALSDAFAGDERTAAAPVEDRPTTAEAGTRVVYGHASAAHEVSEVALQDLERELMWKDGVLAFHDKPLSAVIDEITRYSPYEIRIVDPELRSLIVSGYYPVSKVETVFTALRDGFGLQVEEVDADIFEISKRM